MVQHSKGTKYTFEQLMNEDVVDEFHMQAFAHALELDDHYFDHNGDASPVLPVTPNGTSSRIRKISALSDFAPVHVKVNKRRRKKDKHKRDDWWFLLLRWPLLGFIFLFIAAEFGLYVIIRQLVNTKEWVTAWRGKKGQLRKRLRGAHTYEEWKDAAKALDEYLQFDEWKKVDEDPFYDWKLVRKVRRSLRNLREKQDARGCLGVLETCIRSNFAAVESPRLYSETFHGTKDLIEAYFDELENSLKFIRETPDLSIEEKKRFFKSANTNLGVTALCLSGGASFGYYHFGIIKAFLDEGILPRVITGTSAGGLIAALVCTRTEDELRALLVPELANKITACEDPFRVWFKRFMKTGARFDSVTWARKCAFFTRGSMTFKEAYLKTGRILNVSVIPADRHSPTKLLNYITAPDTVIWSALLASAAVPGILNPVVLMQKLKDGTIVPWSWGSRFKDGSLRVDIPVQALNLFFNVTNPVVSQVNPHVHLFFFAPRGSAGKPVAHRKGKGWRGNFLLSAAEQWLKLELTKNFKVIRDLELLPQLLGQDWSSVFLQRFDGSVTIWPRTRFWDWFRILTDPDPPELERMLRVGQLVTWPKLHMIKNRYRIEQEILLGRQTVHKISRGKMFSTLQPRQALVYPTTTQDEEKPLPTQPSKQERSFSANGPERPISVDTDAETAFTNGSQWFYRRGRSRKVPSPSPGNDGEGNVRDPLSSSRIRRKWVTDLLEHASNTECHDAEPDSAQPSPESQHKGKITSPGFFSRFNSFHGLSEHKSDKGKGPGYVSNHEYWSSDSSSEGTYGDSKYTRSGSLMNFAVMDPAVEGDGPENKRTSNM